MIKIIKTGEIKSHRRKFSCSFCGSIFVADETDYIPIMFNPLPNRAFGEASARCECPVCHHPCYTSCPYTEPVRPSYGDNLKRSVEPLELDLPYEETEGAE